MKRKVNVLNAQEFQNTGAFFYCTCDDIQSKSKEELSGWFCFAKKITLEKEKNKEYRILSIDPIISFTDKVALMVKVDTVNIPTEGYPVIAVIE